MSPVSRGTCLSVAPEISRYPGTGLKTRGTVLGLVIILLLGGRASRRAAVARAVENDSVLNRWGIVRKTLVRRKGLMTRGAWLVLG